VRSEDFSEQSGVIRPFGGCARCLCSTEPPALSAASGWRCWGCSLEEPHWAGSRGWGLGLASGRIQTWVCGTQSGTGSRGSVAASLRGFGELGRSWACLHPEHHLPHLGAGEVWAFVSDKKAAIVEKTEQNNKKGSLLSTETLY